VLFEDEMPADAGSSSDGAQPDNDSRMLPESDIKPVEEPADGRQEGPTKTRGTWYGSSGRCLIGGLVAAVTSSASSAIRSQRGDHLWLACKR
jgi:hypothetical protein